MQRFLRTGDFWAGLAFAALGAYIVSEARGWVYLNEEGPGAGFFPLWYGVAMIVLSLALVIGAALKGKTRGRTPGTHPDERSASPAVNPRVGVYRALACWGALVASIALMKVVGFIASFALLTWFIVAILCRQRARLAVPLAIAGAVLFWAVFGWGLDMGLPSGLFF
jgi:putative tricarboxylic transport membrane protein